MKNNTLIHAIGNTPLVSVDFKTNAHVFAKLEYLNPSGSIKDRSALFMIEEAERQGIIQPGGTLIEASSGNQGIATAMIGAVKGYKVIITTNEKFSIEKINTIKAYGAELIMCPITDLVEDPRSYHSQAVTLAKTIPNSFLLNQYYNLTNSQGHYTSLGPEIWKQTDGKITHFFSGAGTCGTITGVGRYLKEKNKDIKIIACDAAHSFYSTQGKPKKYTLEGIGIDYVGPILSSYKEYIDEVIGVTDNDGLAMLPVLARKHGILAGASSGAVAYAAQEYAKNLPADAVVVMIMGDSGRAYLSKGYYY